MKKSIARIFIKGTIEKKNENYNQEWLLKTIKDLEKSSRNAALILYIDSPGGSVYESDEVYVAVKKYQEKTKRPVYAYFASIAASGGYYIGCSASKIFANQNTLTGSIGVISGRFVDLTELMKKYGIKSEIIHTGKNKTMGSVTETPTKEQKAIMQTIADECYEQFTSLVAENRKMDLSEVKVLADGRIYTARQAKANKLIDEISTYEECVESIKEDLFKNKEAKNKVVDYKYKKKDKSFIHFLKGMSSVTDLSGGIVQTLLGKTVPFPAYFWDGNL